VRTLDLRQRNSFSCSQVRKCVKTDRQTDRQTATFIDNTQDLELAYDGKNGTLRGYIRLCSLGASRKFAKKSISFVISVRLSVRLCVCPPGPTRLPLDTKFIISVFFEKNVEKIQVSFKSDRNNEYLM
jgi:hypothetical protein